MCGSADLIAGERGAGRGHVMNAYHSPPLGKTLADLAGLTAQRAKMAPDPAEAAAARAAEAAARANAAGAGGGAAAAQAPTKKLPPLPPTPAETSRMARAMLATLFLSDGIPCVTSGDEDGHSRGGRDGAPWAFKNDANAFRWDALAPDAPGADIAAFVAAMAAFRKRRADLFANGGANVRWSGMDGLKAPAWEDPPRAARADVPPRRHPAAGPEPKPGRLAHPDPRRRRRVERHG